MSRVTKRNPAARPGASRMRVGIIGAGRVGSAIAWHCQRLGYRISGVTDRRPRQAWVVYGLLKLPYRRLRSRDVAAESDVLFLTVPDTHLWPEFEAVSRWLLPGTIVAHCSGTFGVDVFKGAHEQGLETLALHPIQSFSSHAQAIASLKGCYFALEGTPRGLRFGRRLVRQLRGGHIVVRSGNRPLYHAMCVFGSNFVNALLDAVETIARQLHLPRTRAVRMLRPLTQTVLDKAVELGAVATLTGPVQRGDAETVRRQLAALKRNAPELVPVYRVLSLRLVDMSRGQGADRTVLQKVRAAIESAGR
ncbi:MAG: DUF2520 domain-containing protein [candidate division WOR-3 bacterium]